MTTFPRLSGYRDVARSIEDGKNRHSPRLLYGKRMDNNWIDFPENAIHENSSENLNLSVSSDFQQDSDTISLSSYAATIDSTSTRDADISSITSGSNDVEFDDLWNASFDKEKHGMNDDEACSLGDLSSTLSPSTPSKDRMIEFSYSAITMVNNESSDTPDESDVFKCPTGLKNLRTSTKVFGIRRAAVLRLDSRISSDDSDNDNAEPTHLPAKRSKPPASTYVLGRVVHAKYRLKNTLYDRIAVQLSISKSVKLNACEVSFMLSVQVPSRPPELSVLSCLSYMDFSGEPNFGCETSLFPYLEKTSENTTNVYKNPLVLSLDVNNYTSLLLCEPNYIESGEKVIHVQHDQIKGPQNVEMLAIFVVIGPNHTAAFVEKKKEGDKKLPETNTVVSDVKLEIHECFVYGKPIKGRSRVRKPGPKVQKRTAMVMSSIFRPEVTEETQSGLESVLSLSKKHSTLNAWRAFTNTRCTISLLHRDFSTSTLSKIEPRFSGDRHEVSEGSTTADGYSAVRGSIRRFTVIPVNFDVKEITSLLHASDYSKIIQVLGELPDDPSDETYIPSYFISGVAYFKLAQYQNAREHFKMCKFGSTRTNRAGDVMLCCAYLGDIEYALQNYDAAAKLYETGIENYCDPTIAVMFKLTPPTLSAIHAKRASAYRNVAKMVEAVKGYKMAIEVAQVDRDRLSAHTSLGNLYQSMGDNSSALEEYKQSIELAKKLSDHVSLGWAHGNIGNAYLGLNKKDEALHHLQKSLDLAVEYEQTPQAIGRTYNNLGTAYQSMNDLDKAEEYYDLALSQAIYGNDIPGQARVYGNIGNVYMLRKNYERAIPHYSEVLRLSSDDSTISTARHNRGCAYYEMATYNHMSEARNGPMPCNGSEHVVCQPKCVDSLKSTSGSPLYENYSSPCDGVHSCDHSHLKTELNKPSGDICRQTGSASSINGSCVDITPKVHGPDCDVDICLSKIPQKAQINYRKGCEDLEKVVDHHEKRFLHIKGTPNGLTMSISLFESNSRTFHRLQDCLVNLHQLEQALLVAEQSRARSLGELMLRRKKGHLKESLTSPLSFENIKTIVRKQDSPLVYFSYTGARLIGWVFVPQKERISMNMFEVPLSDDQFEGKSFDYHLRYSLTEKLVERSFEMYQSISYDRESSEPVQTLFKLIAKPTLGILEKLNYEMCMTGKSGQLIVISDSYTSLLPLSCLLDPQGDMFFGDHHGIQVMPSLLTMGILNQLPDVIIKHGNKAHDLCIIGDPTIPPFSLNGEIWALGRLPYARREAERVAYALKTSPILGDHATKEALKLRLQSAKIVHIATHGSAAAGFLAFATFGLTIRVNSNEYANCKNVLLYPEEVEKLNISPALVVLSSCDSGRGTVKADGIQGMARAFILAGAQSVLTTLWKVPDESASVFMQFFYQYLIDGFQSSIALQKSILSVRCFAKYSQYIHWSGYQLTGRNIRYVTTDSSADGLFKENFEEPTVFPRLDKLKLLQSALVKNSVLPSDVQILRGCPGVKPSEVAIDFIHSYYKHFSGGIFWVCCRHPGLLDESIKIIEKIIGIALAKLSLNETHQALFIFDNMDQLPVNETYLRALKNKYVHIIVVSEQCTHPSDLEKEIDHKLVRGCKFVDIDPLSMIQSTQRMVYPIVKEHNLLPNNGDQLAFESLAMISCGSPIIVDIATQLLCRNISQGVSSHDTIMKCYSILSNDADEMHGVNSCVPVRTISEALATDVVTIVEGSEGKKDVWMTNSEYDSWDSIYSVINECHLSTEEKLLLNCLSLFGSSPIPFFVITEISSLIATSAQKQHLTGTLHMCLLKLNFIKVHPQPVVYYPEKMLCQENKLVYVPEFVSQCIWKTLDNTDKIAAFTFTHISIKRLSQVIDPSTLNAVILFELYAMLLKVVESNFKVFGQDIHQEVFSFYLNCQSWLL